MATVHRGQGGLLQHIHDPVVGCVHSGNACSDNTSEQTDHPDFHRDHLVQSQLLVDLKEDCELFDVVLLLGRDGLGVPRGAIGRHRLVAIVQFVVIGSSFSRSPLRENPMNWDLTLGPAIWTAYNSCSMATIFLLATILLLAPDEEG